MIFFDVTKSHRARHRSGLIRVNERLLTALGSGVVPVIWQGGGWRTAPVRARVASLLPTSWRREGEPVSPGRADWVLLSELFSEEERPGLWEFFKSKQCRTAAIFHDAIPLRLPEISLRKSVKRHPFYMAMLADTDHVIANSRASRRELLDYWRWQERTGPEVSVATLGSDFSGTPRMTRERELAVPAELLCVGILEPRKNQSFLLDACAELWDEGLVFDLHLVGRANDETGDAVVEKVRRHETLYKHLRYHAQIDDTGLGELYQRVRAAVFPTIAEGFGLPVAEALWSGIPCLCSDLPVLREQTDGGGSATAPVNDLTAWVALLRRAVTDGDWVRGLQREARERPLPTWNDTAAQVREVLC